MPPPPPPPGPPSSWGTTPNNPYVTQTTVEHPDGTTVLVLGILGLVVCGIIGPFAWKMGNKALREIDSRPDLVYSNRSNVTAGRILGMVSTAFLALGAVFLLIWLVFAVAVFSGNGI